MYVFPVSPKEMIERSRGLSQQKQQMRLMMIKLLNDLAKRFSQDQIDHYVVVDIDKYGEIIGMDMSAFLLGYEYQGAMCVGCKKILLKNMPASAWVSMRC